MAKTIDHLTLTVGVTAYEHEGCQYDALLIIVAYYKGRGFRVSWQPVKLTGYGYQTGPIPSSDPLVNGGAFVAKEATKNNVKTLEQMRTNLEAACEGIKYYFDQRDFDGLEKLMGDVANYGYPYDREQQIKQLINNNINNQNNSEAMKQDYQVTDLIGKSISNGGNAKYTINAIEGDKVSVTFQMGNSEGKPMTMGVAQVEKLLQGGWQVENEELRMKNEEGSARRPEGESQFATAAEEPAAKTVTMEQPKQEEPKAEQPAKPKVTLRKKQPQAEAEEPKPQAEQPKGKLVYSTYTNAKGKTCAKVSGFAETDAAYQKEAAASLHGSATYDNTKQGRVNFLLFGPHYAEVAKTVCQMLNEGKTVADCQAVVDAATEERMAKREEWKQKRAAYREQHEGKAQTAKPQGKTYTEAEMLDLMERVMRGDADALAEVNAIKAKAA